MNLDDMFTYHQPTEEDQVAYRNIRAVARVLAQAIVDNTPACPDQTAAIRKVREAVMTANAAIALKGRA